MSRATCSSAIGPFVDLLMGLNLDPSSGIAKRTQGRDLAAPSPSPLARDRAARYAGGVATFLFALAALAALVLLVLDLVVLRASESLDVEGEPAGARARSSGERAGAGAAFLLGVIGFPGTLAPVVLTVLAFQANPITTDGWVALLAVIVASLSMSAAVKSFRIAQLLGRVKDESRRLLGATVIYLLVWALLVVVLLGLARAPEGPVRLLIWVYVGVLLAGTVVVGATARDLVGTTVRPRAF